MRSLLLITLLFSIRALADCTLSLGNDIELLFHGTFEQSVNSAHCITKSNDAPYGANPNQIKSIFGEPHQVFIDKSGIDYYYKTASGPYWFYFAESKLVKKGLIRPGRWRGTNEELVALWEKRKLSNSWYTWNEPVNK